MFHQTTNKKARHLPFTSPKIENVICYEIRTVNFNYYEIIYIYVVSDKSASNRFQV